jgi:flagellin
MSVTINTNTAATIASNNLSASNAMLQRSLNRLSSGSKIVNASDDAGGVAVASRLSAAAKRSGVANANIGNAVSFLQNQDSALKTLGKVMERMSELQTLNADTTKSVADRSNYTIEFTKLNTQIEAIKTQKFNGLSLLNGQTGLAINVGESAGASFATANMSSALSGVGSFSLGGTAAAGQLEGEATSTFVGTGALGTSSAATSPGNLVINGSTIAIETGDTSDVIVAKINAANAGVTAAHTTDVLTLTSSTWGPAGINLDGSTADVLSDLKLSGGADTRGAYGTINGTGVTAGLGASGDIYTGMGGSAARVALETSIQSVAAARAKNGSDQSVLGYYAELGSATKTNYESAVSKIMDVDVAEESTQLARWNTLVQAGTAMIAQANGSTQSALTLLR